MSRSLNKRDLIILAALLAVGAVGLILHRGSVEGAINGRLYAAVHFLDSPAFMVSLDSDDAFTLAEALRLEPDGLPDVHFVVRDGAFAFVKSDCPDLLCVSMGFQSQLGGFAACLPNRLFFYIEKARYSMYSTVFFDIFDTLVFLRIFAASHYEFERVADEIYNELLGLHRLFDIFNEHEGINNIATINRLAGIEPVTVSMNLLELIYAGIEAYHTSGGAVNIALGPALRLWHEFLTGASDSPPNLQALEAAKLLSNIDDVIIDWELGQIFLAYEGMSLDVGALAKGFALEIAANTARELGVTSGIISMGGDMVIIGRPLDGREYFTIGIENPHGDGLFATKLLSNSAVATSGNYQRFIMYDGVRYHHIIDPSTLLPSSRFSSVTIVHNSPFASEFLSLAAFILPIDEGKRLAGELGAEALWILPDGSYITTDGFVLHEKF